MTNPPRRIVSRTHAAEAALAVIDAHGLDNFRLSAVAEHLGVKAPSFYYHFKSRQELLAEVARILFKGSSLTPVEEVSDWREEIVRVSRASWQSILRHPHAAPLLLQIFPRQIMADAYEYWLRLLTRHNVPPEWHLVILDGADKLTYGSALFASVRYAVEGSDAPPPDGKTYPHFAAASKANSRSDEDLFIETLRCFLRGLPV